AKAAVVAAAMTAIPLARKRAEHTPAAVAQVCFAVADLSWFPLNGILSPVSVEPWHGPALIAVYVDGAAVLSQFANLPALALAAGEPPGKRLRAAAPVIGAWVVASVVLGTLYPSPLVRGDGLRRVYLAADLICLFVTVVALATFYRRGQTPTTSHAVAM